MLYAKFDLLTGWTPPTFSPTVVVNDSEMYAGTDLFNHLRPTPHPPLLTPSSRRRLWFTQTTLSNKEKWLVI